MLLEPREQDAEFFAINPLAFWRRADAIRSGFESVRRTIDQNFDALAEVLPAYGFAMDRKVAARRASRLRSSHGWRVSEREDGPEEMPHLRAVGGS